MIGFGNQMRAIIPSNLIWRNGKHFKIELWGEKTTSTLKYVFLCANQEHLGHLTKKDEEPDDRLEGGAALFYGHSS